jgi:hypothetical protein
LYYLFYICSCHLCTVSQQQCSAGAQCGNSDQGLSLDKDVRMTDTNLQRTDRSNFLCNVWECRHVFNTFTPMFAVLLASILPCVECPGSVWSIMPLCKNVMVLQCVAARFYQKSVSFANINTWNTHKTYSNVKCLQSQLSWYPRCCFLSPKSWQPLFTAKAVSTLILSRPANIQKS